MPMSRYGKALLLVLLSPFVGIIAGVVTFVGVLGAARRLIKMGV